MTVTANGPRDLDDQVCQQASLLRDEIEAEGHECKQDAATARLALGKRSAEML
jgi:hypothetical protein